MRTAELQQAVYDRLTGDANLMAAITGVYTTAPQSSEPEEDTAFPYVTINLVGVRNDDDKDENAISADVDIHLWARSQSALAWRDIADMIYDRMHRCDLSVTGANVIECDFQSRIDMQDPHSLRTWHVVQTFTVLYYPT